MCGGSKPGLTDQTAPRSPGCHRVLKADYSLSRRSHARDLVTTPRRLYEMFGNAALIGGLLGLGGLAATGELTALRATGMSKLRIATSAVGIVAVLMVGVVDRKSVV